MASFLFRLLLVISFFWLARWLFAWLRRISRSMSQPVRPGSADAVHRTITGSMIKDPVCGTYVASQLAIPLKTGGSTLHFCSGACRERYLRKMESKASAFEKSRA